MPKIRAEETLFEFLTYPQVGTDDWRYTSQSAQVRTLEMQMLTRATLLDMANAPDFDAAVASLTVGEYAMGQGKPSFGEIEAVLLEKRAAVRAMFQEWMLDEPVAELLKSRQDFANVRLAIRRAVTDRPIGTDYSTEGNVPPELLVQAFEEDNYELLPDYLRDAVEQAVLAYYQDKQIPAIDYAIDQFEARHKVRRATEIGEVFLLNLCRIEIDLTNIRTVFRVKYSDADRRNAMLEGGFVEADRLKQALEMGNEALGQLFFATPYHRVVEAGAAYFATNESFLKVEQQCEEYMTGYLRATSQITAGPQPIIAYLLLREQEIRTIRLILTAKKNNLDTRLILDRIS